MPIPLSAPYDNLATVTQLVRTYLGDFIQNIVPNLSGVVNTNGLNVTWVSGNKFTALLNNVVIQINGLPYTVAQVTSPITLLLVGTAGLQTGVTYSGVIPTGDIFSDAQAYVVPTINAAWRKLQNKLDYASHPRMRNRTVITNLPVAASLDPSTQQWINWTGFFDGVSQTTTPALPSDFLAPMILKERQSIPAGTNLNRFVLMHPATDGLPTCQKGSNNGLWDWREDALYFIGSILPMDIWMEYQAFLPDIAVAGGGFGSTVVPIMRCAESLAYYSASIFVEPRGGSALAPDFDAKGDVATDAMTNRQSKILQRGSFRRRAVYDSSGRYRRSRG